MKSIYNYIPKEIVAYWAQLTEKYNGTISYQCNRRRKYYLFYFTTPDERLKTGIFKDLIGVLRFNENKKIISSQYYFGAIDGWFPGNHSIMYNTDLVIKYLKLRLFD